jgi:hypothetical protein
MVQSITTAPFIRLIIRLFQLEQYFSLTTNQATVFLVGLSAQPNGSYVLYSFVIKFETCVCRILHTPTLVNVSGFILKVMLLLLLSSVKTPSSCRAVLSPRLNELRPGQARPAVVNVKPTDKPCTWAQL